MDGWQWAALICAVIVIGAPLHWAACWIWPFTKCSRCGGRPQKRSPLGKNWRYCRKCQGTGQQVRWGRRFWVWVAGKKSKAVG